MTIGGIMDATLSKKFAAIDMKASEPPEGQSPENPGHALYPLTALISHSCLCNSKTVLKNDLSNECRATQLIKEGEEITKQYVSPLETTNMRREKLSDGWYFSCRCQRCKDPTELGLFTSSTACLKCGIGHMLPVRPMEPDCQWVCESCHHKTTGQAVDKLVNYFLTKMSSLQGQQIDEWEKLLEQAVKMFHTNHYICTLIRITMNTSYIRLTSRLGMEPDKIPVEVFMRRKDLLDDIHRVVELVEPGLTRRRGISLFETSTCRLQVGRLLHESDRFPAADFLQLCNAEMESLQEALKCLEHYSDGTVEAGLHYKTQGAIEEAEYMIRLLQQKLGISDLGSSSADGNHIGGSKQDFPSDDDDDDDDEEDFAFADQVLNTFQPKTNKQ